MKYLSRRLQCVFWFAIATIFLVNPTTAHAANVSVTVGCAGAPSGTYDHSSITAALAALIPTDTNTITVSGDCDSEGVPGLRITGFSDLRIASGTSGTISRVPSACSVTADPPAVTLSDSTVTFRGIVIDGGTLVLKNSSLTMFGVTVQNSNNQGIVAQSGSTLILRGNVSNPAAPNLIQSNCNLGINIQPGATGQILGPNTIRDNSGIGISTGGSLLLNATAPLPGGGVGGPIWIYHNGYQNGGFGANEQVRAQAGHNPSDGAPVKQRRYLG